MKLNHFARTRLLCSGAIVGAALVLLSACVPSPTSSAVPSESASAGASVDPSTTPSGTPTATPSAPSATKTPSEPGTAVTVTCGTLISAQAVYDFNPNFSLQAKFTPASGTSAAAAVADRGIACSWINQTSSETFTFSVAHPAASSLAALKKTAASGTAVAGYGDSAYFHSVDGAGQVDVFSGAYWMTATSVYFASAADASSLLKQALKALP